MRGVIQRTVPVGSACPSTHRLSTLPPGLAVSLAQTVPATKCCRNAGRLGPHWGSGGSDDAPLTSEGEFPIDRMSLDWQSAHESDNDKTPTPSQNMVFGAESLCSSLRAKPTWRNSITSGSLFKFKRHVRAPRSTCFRYCLRSA